MNVRIEIMDEERLGLWREEFDFYVDVPVGGTPEFRIKLASYREQSRPTRRHNFTTQRYFSMYNGRDGMKREEVNLKPESVERLREKLKELVDTAEIK